MKTSKIIAVALAATLLTAGFTSCGDDYDDTALKGQISDLDQRVTTLEEKVKTDIAAIQASINTINGYDFVKSVKKVTDGYEITFSKGTVAVIKNGTNGTNGTDGKDGINGTDGKDGVDGTNGTDGKDGINGNDGKDGVDGTNGTDGKDGVDGTNGKDGKDGVSPVLTAAKDADGQFYWKVNGEWLMDGANKVSASRTPEITVADFDGKNYWKIDGEWLLDANNAKVPVTADAEPVKFDAEVNEEAGTITFTFAGEKYVVNIAKSELEIVETGVVGFMIVSSPNVYTVDIPAGWDADKTTVRADIASNDENKTAITRTGSFSTFTVTKADGKATVTVNPTSFNAGALAELTITMTSADGEKRAGSIFVTMKVMGSNDFNAATAGSIAEALNSTTDPVFYNAITVSGTSVMNDADWEAINNYPYATTLTVSSTSVTAVPANTLKGNTRLTSFTGNASMTTIGESAFEGCTALTTLATVDAVTTLGKSAFAGCTKLTGVITMALTGAIPESAFDGCTALSHAPIVAAVTEIGDYAFRGCKALTVANLGTATNVTTLGESAFESCERLVDLSSALTSTSLTVYPKNAFKGCKSLTTLGTTGVASIGESAFENCVALVGSQLTVAGGGITTLGAKAFKGCTALVTIPTMATSLKTIPEEAFAGCEGITTTLVANVASIGAGAFKNCEFSGAIAFSDATSIAANAFENTTFGGTVTFAEALTIGNAAFKGCSITGATTFTVATTIGDSAFESCSFGGNATFTKATSIGNRAFAGALFANHTLTFTAPIETVAEDAFYAASTNSATVSVDETSAGAPFGNTWAGATWKTITKTEQP